MAAITEINYDDMFAWEAGELSDEKEIELFQKLIDSGLAWQLQGCYGRQAQWLINNGFCTRKAG
jgi:hypothetical protein